MLGVVNYGVGNLRSVMAALSAAGIESLELIGPDDPFERFQGLVIPGVGAFSVASQQLCHPSTIDALKRFWSRGGKSLGICLGMQVLFEWGLEGERSPGLGVCAGTVEPISPEPGQRLPNMGWRPIEPVRSHPLFAGLAVDATFYFCHSYRCVPRSEDIVLARTGYGRQSIVAAVAHEHAVGVQFHPEKSGARGLALLRNFYHWCQE
jgi:imidazole glycerol phosphate synthase glutamine amidotransferase subunit